MNRGTIEMAKTVMEVAEVAFTALECCHMQHQLHQDDHPLPSMSSEEEMKLLQSENRRLKNLLQQNLELLPHLYECPPDCPPDLHARLMASLDSEKFMNQLKFLAEQSDHESGCKFPFKEASGIDLETAESLINLNSVEPSWWVWVNDEMIPSTVEERSIIDNENYVVVSEESVVDGVANFMAKCVLSNPNAQKLTPEELQKTLTKALCGNGMSKVETMLDIWHAGAMFYALSTWGLALIGLYNTPAVVRVAAMGAHKSSKLILKAF
ncbi:GPI-anchored protein like [Heracleum sosnowskyi]|uniref:GPI-anchored protein like n=1 Tax=Heracleum sosnowskyi TaxID=360622 RepID=A0AAD8MDA3_9APIA|nr:GPI-anchored protein like [Heracleum sosnowskyi]